MDEADRAQMDMEQYSSVRKQQEESPKSTGYCLYCGEKLKNKDQRWCDKDCRDDWEREWKLKKKMSGQ